MKFYALNAIKKDSGEDDCCHTFSTIYSFTDLYRDILVDVLTAPNSIEEHVSHGEEIYEVTRHIAHDICEEVLYNGQNTATHNHHHEDT